MGQSSDRITDTHRAFIAHQKMFFVATAPLAADGMINLSPKGLDGTFAVLDDATVAYLDLVGSGIETVAHLKENGRICVMFCAFDAKPNILRLHGTGDVTLPGGGEYDELRANFAPFTGDRSIIRVRVNRVSDTCGFGVPLYDFVGQRDELTRWADKMGPAKLREYEAKKNAKSLDGLPGLPADSRH